MRSRAPVFFTICSHLYKFYLSIYLLIYKKYINPICGPVLLCSLQSALIYTLGNYRLIISSVGFQNLVFVPCSLPLNPLFLEWKVQKVHFFIPFNVFARFLFVSFTVHNQIYSFHLDTNSAFFELFRG